MKEKFDRSKPHKNIGEIGVNPNETTEEKIARINNTKLKLQGAPIDSVVKDGMISILDKSLKELQDQEQPENTQTIHHR